MIVSDQISEKKVVVTDSVGPTRGGHHIPKEKGGRARHTKEPP